MTYSLTQKEILLHNSFLEKITSDLEIYLIANSSTKTKHKEKRSYQNIEIEFFTDEEIESILESLRELGFYLEVFFDEIDLIQKLLQIKNKDNIIVFNLARNGFGVDKKSLIPSFCELYNIAYTGSNAYACAIARHKLHSYYLLNFNNLPTIDTWMYLGNDKWSTNGSPEKKCLVILKPAFESASKGVSKDNILYSNSCEFKNRIDSLFSNINQPVIVQKFISGYEVQVPIIESRSIITLPPMGIMINNEYNLEENIISEDISFSYYYEYYDFGNEVDKNISKKLQEYASKTFSLLELTNYGRIDFRISDNGSCFIFDISTMPYIIDHSAFCNSFKLMGLPKQDIFKSIIASVLQKKSR